MKRIQKIIFFIFLYFLVCFSGQAKTVRIAIINDQQVKKGDDAIKGFKDALLVKGYRENRDVDYDIFHVENSDAVSQVAAGSYDLICMVGTKASRLAQQAIKDRPLVFMMVLNPVRSGLIDSMGASGSNITGASLNTSVEAQLKLLKKIVPRAVKVGAIYSPRSSRMIGEARHLESSLNLEIISVSVYASTEVPAALRGLIEKVDVFWLIPDGAVCTSSSLAYVLNQSLQSKIAVMGFASNLVKAGALFGYTYNFEDIGKQAGELAARILAGEKPAGIAITVPDSLGYSLNLKSADLLGIRIPGSVVNGADEVY